MESDNLSSRAKRGDSINNTILVFISVTIGLIHSLHRVNSLAIILFYMVMNVLTLQKYLFLAGDLRANRRNGFLIGFKVKKDYKILLYWFIN